jgi:hypothetical protein
MPRADDRSTGDARQPYSDQDGPQGRHAQTHDIRREEATRSKAQPHYEDFAEDLVEARSADHADDTILASSDKEARADLPELSTDDLKRLPILTVGTRLDQGSVYVDLNDLGKGPFKAVGDQEAGPTNRYVAKRDTDYEMWDRVVGQGRPAEVERPGQHN